MKQNLILSSVRIATLAALAMAAFLLVLSEETDPDPSAWVVRFIADKTAGAVAAWTALRLYRRWLARDTWIAAADRWCRRVV